MIAGFDRYYQIAICFRDEDLRADRVQEITQLDVEMSFPEQEELYGVMESMFASIWRECIGVEIATPFPRMTYAEADRRFGSDKPDVRFALEIEDATELTRGSGFGVFGGADAVRFLRVPRAFTRAELGHLEELAKERGAQGLAYIVSDPETGELRSPIVKFLSEAEIAGLSTERGQTLLFAADAWEATSKVLGVLRLHLGRVLDLIDASVFAFLWVTDFPMFEWDEDESAGAPCTTRSRDRPRSPSSSFSRRAGRGAGARLRPRRQRQRARRRLLPDPRARAAGAGVRPADLSAGGAAGEVRLPARRARDGRAAARGHRVRHRSDDDGARPASRTCAT